MLDFGLMAILFKQTLHLRINLYMYADQKSVKWFIPVLIVNGSPSSDSSASSSCSTVADDSSLESSVSNVNTSQRIHKGSVRCRVKATSGGWSCGRGYVGWHMKGYTCIRYIISLNIHKTCWLLHDLYFDLDCVAWQDTQLTSTALPKVFSKDFMCIYQCIRTHKLT